VIRTASSSSAAVAVGGTATLQLAELRSADGPQAAARLCAACGHSCGSTAGCQCCRSCMKQRRQRQVESACLDGTGAAEAGRPVAHTCNSEQLCREVTAGCGCGIIHEVMSDGRAILTTSLTARAEQAEHTYWAQRMQQMARSTCTSEYTGTCMLNPNWHTSAEGTGGHMMYDCRRSKLESGRARASLLPAPMPLAGHSVDR
jgi:hypothetical protein